ncbi:AMP-dependent synthetase [Bradyrhizobium sp. AC87j1]|nr:AMP-dependent synthetase [Bradyrhizobium sp. AC87j1]
MDFTSLLTSFGSRHCLVTSDASVSYEEIAARIRGWQAQLSKLGCRAGQVFAVRSDYSSEACALLLAITAIGAIVVPLSPSGAAKTEEYLEVGQVEGVFVLPRSGQWTFDERAVPLPRHELITQLGREGAPGLILFSSGSTGRSKASLLNFQKLTQRLGQKPGRAYRTLAFLLLDHIGGINTLLNVLGHGGTVVTPASRTPNAVCEAIKRHRVQLLPTSPTFLNMLLISEAYKEHDLSSLELITYGTEPMPEATLAALRDAFPRVRLKQTYGLSELGIMPTQSKSSDSLWMKLGSDGFEHKIVDGILWIRSSSAMLGYLNAPSPFDAEGWFNTQDMVETDGDYVRVLGRRSEIINVGGEKVYPSEVESVLLAAGNVRDVTVSAKANAITGQVVSARVSLIAPEDATVAASRLLCFCESRLERYKVPVKINISDDDHHGDRFKKNRFAAIEGEAQ